MPSQHRFAVGQGPPYTTLAFMPLGGGSGQAIASTVGAAAGGLAGDNMVTAREESQMLEIEISLATGKVSDYNYTEKKGRTQSWGVNSGVAPL